MQGKILKDNNRESPYKCPDCGSREIVCWEEGNKICKACMSCKREEK
jgi:predicted RNA-binding Zn-ribbon protein involved in translation (DUF1610 family)